MLPSTASVWHHPAMSLPHVCLYVCLCVHGTAEMLDCVEEWPDTQTSQQTDVNETYCFQLQINATKIIIADLPESKEPNSSPSVSHCA